MQSKFFLILFLFSSIFLTENCEKSKKTTRPPVNTDPENPVDESYIYYEGQTRTYAIHISELYDSVTPVPLVIALHGYTGTGKGMESYIGFDYLSDKEGFIVVYPDGLEYPWEADNPQAWNAGGPYVQWTVGTNDVGFIEELINTIEDNYEIDPNRIYATGHSNGAFMCYRLAMELSDRIAAIAPVSGQLVYEPTDFSGEPLSIIHFHSADDPVVGYESFYLEDYYVEGVEHVIGNIADLFDCNNNPEIISESDILTIKQWSCSGSDFEIKLYLTPSNGHSWPGLSNSGISASDTIWNFFKNHPKN